MSTIGHVFVKRTTHVDVTKDLELPAGPPRFIINHIERSRWYCPRIIDQDVDINSCGYQIVPFGHIGQV